MPSPNDCNIMAALGILQHQEGDHVQCFKVDVTFIRLCPAQQSTHARQFKLINVKREVKKWKMLSSILNLGVHGNMTHVESRKMQR